MCITILAFNSKSFFSVWISLVRVCCSLANPASTSLSKPRMQLYNSKLTLVDMLVINYPESSLVFLLRNPGICDTPSI